MTRHTFLTQIKEFVLSGVLLVATFSLSVDWFLPLHHVHSEIKPAPVYLLSWDPKRSKCAMVIGPWENSSTVTNTHTRTLAHGSCLWRKPTHTLILSKLSYDEGIVCFLWLPQMCLPDLRDYVICFFQRLWKGSERQLNHWSFLADKRNKGNRLSFLDALHLFREQKTILPQASERPRSAAVPCPETQWAAPAAVAVCKADPPVHSAGALSHSSPRSASLSWARCGQMPQRQH